MPSSNARYAPPLSPVAACLRFIFVLAAVDARRYFIDMFAACRVLPAAQQVAGVARRQARRYGTLAAACPSPTTRHDDAASMPQFTPPQQRLPAMRCRKTARCLMALLKRHVALRVDTLDAIRRLARRSVRSGSVQARYARCSVRARGKPAAFSPMRCCRRNAAF